MSEAGDGSVELGRVVSRNPEIHSGDLVFAATRVPVETLVDYLKSYPTGPWAGAVMKETRVSYSVGRVLGGARK